MQKILEIFFNKKLEVKNPSPSLMKKDVNSHNRF